MQTNQYTEIARAIIANGRPIAVGWYDDGDAESGPRGGVWHGYRWGQLHVSLAANGASAYVESRKAGDGPWGKGTGYPIVWGSTAAEDVLAACTLAQK
jgi:hypothetical protein